MSSCEDNKQGHRYSGGVGTDVYGHDLAKATNFPRDVCARIWTHAKWQAPRNFGVSGMGCDIQIVATPQALEPRVLS